MNKIPLARKPYRAQREKRIKPLVYRSILQPTLRILRSRKHHEMPNVRRLLEAKARQAFREGTKRECFRGKIYSDALAIIIIDGINT